MLEKTYLNIYKNVLLFLCLLWGFFKIEFLMLYVICIKLHQFLDKKIKLKYLTISLNSKCDSCYSEVLLRIKGLLVKYYLL